MDIHTIIQAWNAFTHATQVGAVKDEAHCDYLQDLHERLLDYSYTIKDDSHIPIQALAGAIESLIADYEEEINIEHKRPFLRLVKNDEK